MKDIYNLIWSDEAVKNFESILEFLNQRWTGKEINKFVLLLDKHLKLIEINPFMFPESSKFQGLRKCVISKQVSIYYKIVDLEIRIISIFENRQSPDKLIKY